MITAFTSRRLLALAAVAVAGAALAHAPATHAQQPQFRGNGGHTDSGPIALGAGLTVVHAQSNADGFFAVDLVLPNPGESIQQCNVQGDCSDDHLIFDEATAIKGTAAAILDQPGNWYFSVDAPGPFTLSWEQPTPETVSPVAQQSFSGRGTNVSPYFRLTAGDHTLSASSSGQALRVWLYRVDDLGGGPVDGGLDVYDGRIIDLSFDPTVTSATVTVDDGVYLVAVANITPTDSWTVTIQ